MIQPQSSQQHSQQHSQQQRTQYTLGISRMFFDSTYHITKIVKDMHQAIVGPHILKYSASPVYRMLEISSSKMKTHMDTLLERQDNDLPLMNTVDMSNESHSQRVESCELYLSALNGIIGDYLFITGNPLALPMQLRTLSKSVITYEPKHHWTCCDPTQLLSEYNLNPTSQTPLKLAIFIHGSCMSERQWQTADYSYIDQVKQMGYFPLFLRYNSGLHISQNGKLLSQLMERLCANLQQSLKPEIRFSFICHSMGGLVARSACYYAETENTSVPKQWLTKVEHLITLGTPHQGALLERCGNLADLLLTWSRYSLPFATLAKIRSCGITDLRYGTIIEDDWRSQDRFKLQSDKRTPTPLPKNVQFFSVAATLNKKSNSIYEKIIGDGLVSVGSALGHNTNKSLQLELPKENQYIAYGKSHNQLLGDFDLGSVLCKWLQENV